jgi:hypothetical protein
MEPIQTLHKQIEERIKASNKPPKKKRGRGRPSRYKHYDKTYPVKLLSFYDRPAFVDGKLNKLPSLVQFCRENEIPYRAMTGWLSIENRSNFEELHAAWEECKSLLERNIVEAGFSGKSNALFTIFAAKNLLGWREKSDLSVENKTGWASIAKRSK